MGLSYYVARGSQKTSPIIKYLLKLLSEVDETDKQERQSEPTTSPPNVGTGVQSAQYAKFIPPPTQPQAITINIIIDNK